MAISEACGLWIEQRVREELDTKGESGISLREIGRKVSAEIEKYFETEVNPETIKSRAIRQLNRDGSNEPPKDNPVTKGAGKKIKNNQTRGHGGRRPGAGRPAKNQSQRWQQAETMLRKLMEFMTENCKEVSEIDDQTRQDILKHISLLKVYEEDLCRDIASGKGEE